MSLHADLLEQADFLLARDPHRPRQSSLRSAVSSAYFSLYHLLTAECAKLLLYTRDGEAKYALLRRSFAHADMSEACAAYARNALPAALQREVPDAELPDTAMTETEEPEAEASDEIAADAGNQEEAETDNLRALAAAFRDLQEAWERAEYDHTHDLTRSSAAVLVARASQAHERWKRIRSTDDARFFLLALLLWPRWERF